MSQTTWPKYRLISRQLGPDLSTLLTKPQEKKLWAKLPRLLVEATALAISQMDRSRLACCWTSLRSQRHRLLRSSTLHRNRRKWRAFTTWMTLQGGILHWRVQACRWTKAMTSHLIQRRRMLRLRRQKKTLRKARMLKTTFRGSSLVTLLRLSIRSADRSHRLQILKYQATNVL